MPDFIAVDEINSQVITSESNTSRQIKNSESNIKTQLGSFENNIQYNFNEKSKEILSHISPIDPKLSGTEKVVFNYPNELEVKTYTWNGGPWVFCKFIAPKTAIYKFSSYFRGRSSSEITLYCITSSTPILNMYSYIYHSIGDNSQSINDFSSLNCFVSSSYEVDAFTNISTWRRTMYDSCNLGKTSESKEYKAIPMLLEGNKAYFLCLRRGSSNLSCFISNFKISYYE